MSEYNVGDRVIIIGWDTNGPCWDNHIGTVVSIIWSDTIAYSIDLDEPAFMEGQVGTGMSSGAFSATYLRPYFDYQDSEFEKRVKYWLKRLNA